jgi:hypothetical protein
MLCNEERSRSSGQTEAGSCDIRLSSWLAKLTKNSDLNLIVYVGYTEEIADMFILYVVLFNTMHGDFKYASDR